MTITANEVKKVTKPHPENGRRPPAHWNSARNSSVLLEAVKTRIQSMHFTYQYSYDVNRSSDINKINTTLIASTPLSGSVGTATKGVISLPHKDTLKHVTNYLLPIVTDNRRESMEWKLSPACSSLCLRPNLTVDWLDIQIPIREITGSKLGLKTCCSN
jgi:hypothetical protein